MSHNLFISSSRIIIKLILFVVIVILLINFLGLCFHKKSGLEIVWNKIYDSNEKYELLSFGNSHSFVTVNTNLLNTCGIKSMNIGASAEYFPQTYYNFLEALKYQDPDFVLMELNSLFFDGIDGYENRLKYIYSSLIGMKLSINRIKMTMAILPQTELFKTLSPLFIWHNNWANFNELIENYQANKEEILDYNYFARKTHIISDEDWANMERYNRIEKYTSMEIDPLEISEKNIERLEHIINICNERNIKLVLFKSPVADSRFYSMAKQFEILEKNYEIDILDYNMLYEELGLSQIDFADGGHVNINGSNKVSIHILQNVLGKMYGADYDFSLLEASSFIKQLYSYDLNENTYQFVVEHYNPDFIYQFNVYLNKVLIYTSEPLESGTFKFNFEEPGEYSIEYIATNCVQTDIENNHVLSEYFYDNILIE